MPQSTSVTRPWPMNNSKPLRCDQDTQSIEGAPVLLLHCVTVVACTASEQNPAIPASEQKRQAAFADDHIRPPPPPHHHVHCDVTLLTQSCCSQWQSLLITLHMARLNCSLQIGPPTPTPCDTPMPSDLAGPVLQPTHKEDKVMHQPTMDNKNHQAYMCACHN